jgi:hypothetical protein
VHKTTLTALLILALANTSTISADSEDSPAFVEPKWFHHIERTQIPLCYEYSCKIETTFKLSDSQWQQLKNLFVPPAKSAKSERNKIRQGIQWLEQWAGEQSPTFRDKAKNYQPDAIRPGQLDCIDETTNSTTYMTLFSEQGWLLFHQVKIFVQRNEGFFLGHYGAQIYDTQSKEYYAVDSWLLDNGEKPFIQKLDDWKSKKPAPTTGTDSN